VVELETHLAGAAAASPGKRIEYRDPIATHGLAAIAPMRQWLGDDRLAAFAVRTLIAIAKDQAHRLAVIEVLRSIDLSTASPIAVDDVADALRALTPSGPAATATARAEALDHGPITESMTPLEREFHDEMLAIFTLAGEATRKVGPDGRTIRGYWASYFLRGVRNHGGRAYAKQLLAMSGTTAGFDRLREERRLDLSVEALVLRPKYLNLFTDCERSEAMRRLTAAGFQIPGLWLRRTADITK